MRRRRGLLAALVCVRGCATAVAEPAPEVGPEEVVELLRNGRFAH